MRIAFFAAIAALALALPAQAAPPAATPEFVTARVSLRDLDLSSAKDLATLRQRVRVAIRQVCDRGSSSVLLSANAKRDCRVNALAEANIQIERHRQQTLALLTLPRG